MNLIAYAIYLAIITLVIVVVGGICFRNGNVFVSALIPGHEALCHRINQLLLLEYYLVNIGYAAMSLVHWQKVVSPEQLIETVASKTAFIVCLLSVMHYLNIFLITKYVNKLIH
jgi:hypothetical protein